jgi:ethanolamine utilization cobalamin adenosyltransferase
MNCQFKQSVVIGEHKFTIHQNGQPKVFSVPPEVVKHKHFKHFKKAGLIVPTDAALAPAEAETIEQRNLRLHKKLAEEKGLQKVTSEEETDDSSFDDEAAAASDSDDDFGDEETPKKKVGKKSKK